MSITYRSTTDHAADIRQAYKARGWSSRQISVRSEYFANGSAIDVTIKDGSIPVPLAKAIAEGHERIHRCEITGEILSGSNRYVSIRVTDEAQVVKARRYIQAVEEAIAKLEPAPTNTLQPIGETGYCVGREHSGYGFSLWGETSHVAGYMNDAQAVAYQLAVTVERQEYEATNPA
jgi:hypothetical protein